MKEVKHSGIALNRNDINNRELVFCSYDKICKIRSPMQLPLGYASCFSEFPRPGEGDAEDHAVTFISIRLMKQLPFQSGQVVSRKGLSIILISLDPNFFFEKDHDDDEVSLV
ncbi:hypothetical protein CDAR_585141 [Caerostris darwini]|uniref:Uncharacterized protein n=1 Tax=Caerostris darwini TaxID=1538125 RepID=A0AAV4T1A8_9ARAC|nr:hypothetical protein CDAR_585141 [Caerostris darwini]